MGALLLDYDAARRIDSASRIHRAAMEKIDA